MWILPKQLHTLASALDTEALILDSSEQSQACAQSLLVRSKPLPARTWSQKWKRDCWTQHLSGRILKPSRGTAFVEKWTSPLAGIPVSHSAQQENDSAQTTQDTCGHSLQMELPECNQLPVSLKTSMDTLPLGCATSCKTWDGWVTEQRGEYSARRKLAHRTSGNECLSWPTATTRDWKDTGDLSRSNVRRDGKSRMDTLGRVVQASSNTHGNHPESWPTPNAFDGQRPNETPEQWAKRNAEKKQANPNSGTLHRPLTVAVQQWATPRSCSAMAATITPEVANDPKHFPNLETQVGRTNAHCGKLNPRWVETLMGLPVGWTMPSCASPVTIEQTNCDCSATESCPQQQSELF